MIELAIPTLVFFLMYIIGVSLEKRDVNEIHAQSYKILILTLGQVLLLLYPVVLGMTLRY